MSMNFADHPAIRALVVYESIYGNTHAVADAIARGLDPAGRVAVVPVGSATPHLLDGVDLLVVGGPTHAHGMTRSSTRRAAIDAAAKEEFTVDLDAATGVNGPGLREWLEQLEASGASAAAFDTRLHGPTALTGSAAKKISRQLARRGLQLTTPPQSFFIAKDGTLDHGEADRAQQWGIELASLVTTVR